jgi:putative addiction module killer protein
MPQVVQTERFRDWLGGLKDRQAAARVIARVERIGRGNLGDVKPVGRGVSETRIDYGPGYRVYFASKGATLIVLLAGGDKSTQAKDIKAAKALWEAWKEASDE